MKYLRYRLFCALICSSHTMAALLIYYVLGVYFGAGGQSLYFVIVGPVVLIAFGLSAIHWLFNMLHPGYMDAVIVTRKPMGHYASWIPEENRDVRKSRIFSRETN